LYVYVDNADKAFAKAAKAGATVKMPVIDMFWGESLRRRGVGSPICVASDH
jgi:uncharacterized glyoxalase superfamily protein PhnB